MKRLRFLLYPVLCFGLAWGAVHFVRLMSAVSEAPRARSSLPPSSAVSAPSTRASRMEKLRADFAAAKPGQWSALWHAFAAQASIADLEVASRQSAMMFPVLASEELALRAGNLSGGRGAFAAFASRDADEAFKLAKRSGESSFQCAVLRIMAQSDPGKALSLALRLPAGRRMSIEEAYAIGRTSEPDTPPGSVFSAWARRDPRAALAAAGKSPAKSRWGAVGQVVRQWAYRDGPAALRYLAQQVPGRKLAETFRMDYILRAAFLSDPAGSARVLLEFPALADSNRDYVWLGPWCQADPQGVQEWMRTGKNINFRAVEYLIRALLPGREQDALALIREFPQAASPDHAEQLAVIAATQPAAALAVADELGLRAKVEAELRFAEIKADPAAACDRWLAAIAKHGAEKSLSVLGWTSGQALQLAAFASHALPEKAAALAAVVPASVLMPQKRYIGSDKAALKFWPELQPETIPPDATAIPPDPKPPLPFAANPAAAAASLLRGEVSESDAAKAVRCWAPHDFAAAKAWVGRLPEGAARRTAELALATEQAINDPAAALTAALSGRFDAPPELWQQCIHRIALTGGDWKAWAAKAPAGALNDQRFTNRNLTEAFDDDVRVLAAIREAAK